MLRLSCSSPVDILEDIAKQLNTTGEQVNMKNTRVTHAFLNLDAMLYFYVSYMFYVPVNVDFSK